MQSLQTYLQYDYIHKLPSFYFTSSHDAQVFNEGNCQQQTYEDTVMYPNGCFISVSWQKSGSSNISFRHTDAGKKNK